jgi:hypothetical protein
MTNTRIAQAVAAALALSAAGTSMAALTDITSVPAANVLYLSGSTAIDPGLTSYWITGASAPCDPTTAVFYTGTTGGKQFVAVACSATGASTFSGNNIAMIKEDTGGSLNGIIPVREPAPLLGGGLFPDFTTLNISSNCGTVLVAAPGKLTCTGYGTSTVLPNVGFADVDPAMFGANLISTVDSLASAQFDTLDVVFAPAASLGLRNYLQTVEGLPSGDDSATSMPRLSKGTLEWIFTNGASITPDWRAVLPSVGTASINFGHPGTTTPSTTGIYVCQRGLSSGTERTAQIFFGNQNCASGVRLFAAPTQATCQADGCSWTGVTAQLNGHNFAGNGTGDVLSCLQAQNDLEKLAIGFASIDNPWGTFQSNTARQEFRYIRVGQAVPSIETAGANDYDYWAQSIGVFPNAGHANNPTGVAGAVANYIALSGNRVGSCASISALNGTHVYQTAPVEWDAGFLCIPSSGITASPQTAALATFQANPANPYVHTQAFLTTGFGPTYNCQPTVPAQNVPNVSPSDPTWLAPPLF